LEFVGIDSREFIWDTFRPLLAGIDDEGGVDREVFSVKSSDHDRGQAASSIAVGDALSAALL
jgi:hypothetical protein